MSKDHSKIIAVKTRTRRLFLSYFLLTCLASFLTMLMILISESDPKNAWLFGLSRTRWGLLFVIGGATIVFVCGVVASLKESYFHALHGWMTRWLNQKRVFGLVIGAAINLALCGGLYVFFFPYTVKSPIHFYLLRLLPIVVWLGVLGLLTLGLVFYWRRLQSGEAVSSPDLSSVWVVTVLLIGVFIRLVRLTFFDISLPDRGGGLFVEFAHQILANNFLLPSWIPFYTVEGIPFAYPPLPFYLLALALKALLIPEIWVANVLPPLIAAMSPPAFYALTRAVGLDFKSRIASTLAFAAMPSAFYDQTEAPGLAEALGTLMLILFAIVLSKVYRDEGLPSKRGRKIVAGYLPAGVLWGACVLSSPGSAVGSVAIFFIFAMLQARRKNSLPFLYNIAWMIVIGGVALLVSSPYWLTVTINHGLSFFVNALGARQSMEIARLMKDPAGYNLTSLSISGAYIPRIWDDVVLIGAIWALLNRRWWLTLCFVIFWLTPREGSWLVSIPASLLAGIGVIDVGVPLVRHLVSGQIKPPWIATISMVSLIITGYVMINIRASLVEEVADYNREKLVAALDGMEWARQHTSSDAVFVVFVDGPLMDWFPHLVRRKVINNFLGTELIPEQERLVSQIRKSLLRCKDFACVRDIAKETSKSDKIYVYFQKRMLSGETSMMDSNRENDATFNVLWSNSDVVIGQLSNVP